MGRRWLAIHRQSVLFAGPRSSFSTACWKPSLYVGNGEMPSSNASMYAGAHRQRRQVNPFTCLRGDRPGAHEHALGTVCDHPKCADGVAFVDRVRAVRQRGQSHCGGGQRGGSGLPAAQSPDQRAA